MARSVPFVSQLNNAPRNDCGLACVLMLALWIRPEEKTTVHQLSVKYDPTDDGTTALDLEKALKWLGFTPVRSSVARYPFIQLVDYLKLPAQNRYDNVSRLHWIVRLSDTTYHDPYHAGQRGAFLSAPKDVLDSAERGVYNRVGIIERPEEDMRRYQRVVHVVPQDVTRENYNKVADVALPLKQSIIQSWDDAILTADGPKVRPDSVRVIAWGIPPANQAAYLAFARDYNNFPSIPITVEFRQFSSDPVIPNPPPSVIRGGIGVHCIHDVQAGRHAVSLGAPVITVMSNYQAAREFADRGALVFYREYIGWPHDGRQLAEKVLAAAGGNLHPNIIHLSFNECDNGLCYGTPEEIRIRASFDSEYKNIILSKGGKVAIGGFSMGTPDYTNPAICAAMKEFYAPLYNNDDPKNPRVFFNYHSYSNNGNGLVSMGLARSLSALDAETMAQESSRSASSYDPIWLETRWIFAFTRCGFRPDKRAVISDETGEDEGGVGGFAAHKRTPEFVAQWCKAMRAVSSQNIVVDGRTYPSPWVGATLFMYGGDATWSGGYDCRQYTEAIRQAVW